MLTYAQQSLNVKDNRPAVFLAGPSPRTQSIPSWRAEAVEYLKDHYDIFIPEFEDGHVPEGEFDHSAQIEWEQNAMVYADIILFWIPRNDSTMLGLTTNDEFGYWRASKPSKLVLGVPEGSFRTRYQLYWANKLDIPTANTLKEACDIVISKMYKVD